MKKFLLLLVSVCMALPQLCVAAPAVKKNVAVYVTGGIDSKIKRVIGSKMAEYLSDGLHFAAKERSADFIGLRTGKYKNCTAVTPSVIAEMGGALGADYVLLASVDKVLDGLYGEVLLIDVVSGETIATASGSAVSTSSMGDLYKLAKDLADGLADTALNSSVVTVTTTARFYTGPVETFNVNGETFEMVRVEGGTYGMGTTDKEPYGVCTPVHSETVGTFYIGRTEVTQGLWEAVMGNNPAWPKGRDLPVESVSWEDCQEFCEKLSQLTGVNFRLPTEAEWEYAARGGNKTRGYKYSGSNSCSDVAWYDGNSGQQTHPVATMQPNELGIYDMCGNLWEWTSDLWCSDYGSDRDGGSSGIDRVQRGGCAYGDFKSCRLESRSYDKQTYRSGIVGLRLAF